MSKEACSREGYTIRILSTDHATKEEVDSQMSGIVNPSTRETNTPLAKLVERGKTL